MTLEETLINKNTDELFDLRVRAFIAEDAKRFYEVSNYLDMVPQEDDIEYDLYNRGWRASQPTKNDEILNPSSNNEINTSRRLYYNHPSEVIYVPNKREIRRFLKQSYETNNEPVPTNLNKLRIDQCYAIYFKRAGVEKYDPRKHDN